MNQSAASAKPSALARGGNWWVRAKREASRNKYVYLMALPVIAYYLLFQYGPMYGAQIAFRNYAIRKGVWASEWVGIQYFDQFFMGPYFLRLISNTLLISVYQIIFGFPAPIILALLLNEIRSKAFKRSVQTIVYLPHFISMVVICSLVRSFVGRNSIITDMVVMLGGERANLLGLPQYFRTIYVASGIWQTIGWGSILYLSALTAIDQQQYEAAMVDGANRFQQMWAITLPGLAPTIVTMFILRVGQVMSVGYEKIILLYNPNIYETADVISSYVYRVGLAESAQYSYSSAVGLFTSAVNFAMVITANTISRKVGDSSIW